MNSEISLNELEHSFSELLLQKFPEVKKSEPTFLEIGGFPHYENVISNFYAFYFDSKENHGFKDLFLRSLVDLVCTDRNRLSIEDFEVWTEVQTKKNNRIDILIEESDGTKAIIIENKIYHHLHNDFEDYWNYSDKATEKIGVLLTLHQMSSPHKNFANITHLQLLKKVNENIGSILSKCSDKHLIVL